MKYIKEPNGTDHSGFANASSRNVQPLKLVDHFRILHVLKSTVWGDSLQTFTVKCQAMQRIYARNKMFLM